MITTAIVILTMSSPILVVIGLLVLAAWRDHRREAMVARHVRLTDAPAAERGSPPRVALGARKGGLPDPRAGELGPIVAPLVAKPLGGPWRVEIRVPVGR